MCGSALKLEQLLEAKKKEDIFEEAQEAEIPSSGITIEFPYSSSLSFYFAVEEAKKHPAFRQFGEGKKVIYRVTYNHNEMEAAAKLAEYLKGWRSVVVYLDGSKTTWDSVISFAWCFKKRQASYKPEYYCYGFENKWQHNIWGCINSQLNFREHDEWFCWGEFIDDRGTWRFDKNRIRRELERNLYPYRFCPAFDEDKLKAVLDAFPIEVDPTKDKNWKFIESCGDDSGPGLLMLVKRDGFNKKVMMKGVCPDGYGAIRDIAKKLTFKIPLGFDKKR